MGLALIPSGAAATRGRAGRNRLRRVLHLFQLLPDGVGAAADGALLPAQHRAAAASDRRASRGRLLDAPSAGLLLTEAVVARSGRRPAWRGRRRRLRRASSCSACGPGGSARSARRCSRCTCAPLSLAGGSSAASPPPSPACCVSLRAVARRIPRALLTAQSLDAPRSGDRPEPRRAPVARSLRGPGARAARAGVRMPSAQAGAFFGAGAAAARRRRCSASVGMAARPGRGRSPADGSWAVARPGIPQRRVPARRAACSRRR